MDLVLKHESWQEENGQKCLVKFEIAARILGNEATAWQHRRDTVVDVSGMLAQRSQRFPKPMLRIQNITEHKD